MNTNYEALREVDAQRWKEVMVHSKVNAIEFKIQKLRKFVFNTFSKFFDYLFDDEIYKDFSLRVGSALS